VNVQEANDVVERLRRVAKAGGPVTELLGDDARDFLHVKDKVRRKVLLGSFAVDTSSDAPFFVSVISKSGRDDDFQVFVNKRRRGFPSLVTEHHAGSHLEWRYQPRKQSGDNAARLRAFIDANGTGTIDIPLPESEVSSFANAIRRAIDERQKADGESGQDDEDVDTAVGGDLDGHEIVAVLKAAYSDLPSLNAAAQTMLIAIREAHIAAPTHWSVTYRKDRGLLRLNVGIGRVFDLGPNGMLIAVDTDQLTPDDVRAIDAKLDKANALNERHFGANGAVTAKPLELADLLPRLLPAYRSVLLHAAKTQRLHQRHHNPAALEAIHLLTGEEVPSPELTFASTTAFWKIAPGAKGADWQRCREQGFIAVGWDDMGDLRALNREQFDAKAQQLGHKPGVEQLWKFRNISVGDRIIANNGTTRVLGVGTVTGPYYYVDGEEHCHRLPVEWNDVVERSVDMKGWRQTLVRLTEATFDELQAAPAVDDEEDDVIEATPGGGIDFDGILSHLESKSLSFSAEMVATYLLALQARRFVLLTGISGTGKTQLALEIARLFAPEPLGTHAHGTTDAVELVVQIDHVKRGRFVVPAKLSKQLDALYDEERKRIDVRFLGRPAESLAMSKDPERPSLLMLLLSGETKTLFQRTIGVGDRLLLRREVSGSNETLVVERTGGQTPLVLREPAHELIAVRPDWTDARALVGFYNPLTKGYISTPTLDLLRKAHAEVERASTAGLPPRPYFLVFDEMNLARVEHYFSDFLSAMESGEEIHLHDDDDLAEADDDPVPKRIRIPKNIFVVGTVNIDETTYMFSPKVLDRAFVLEFNHVDLDALAGRSAFEDPASTPLALTRMGAGLKLLGRSDDAEWTRFEAALDGELARQLKKLHGALTADNRHFGYRVAREIARFVDLAGEQSAGSRGALRAAFDVAILSKVLPKLHGGQAEIDGPLARLFAVAIGSDPTSDDVKQLDRFAVNGTQLQRVVPGEDLPMPRTALKLWRMRHRLRAQGFVSFIE
jgi:5-methylcytosine-specific restriction protein B